jgi:ubiquinone/menaquinone biosynthesis C-methylase UbiE
MRLLPLLFLVGCGSTAPRPSTNPCPACPATTASQPAAAAPAIDDNGVIAKSRAFLEAIDKRDIPTFKSAAATTFGMFEFGRTRTVQWIATGLDSAVQRKAPPNSRKCRAETVRRSATTAIYTALCTETIPAFEGADEANFDGWSVMVWVVEDGAWKLAHWTWSPGGGENDIEYWDNAFAQKRNVPFKHTPNQHLIDSIKGLKPGTAIDIAMGQGRNAIYIASQGWKTTGIDFSEEGLRIAKETAAKQNLKLETINHDMETYDYGKNKYDLVSFIYVTSTPQLIEKMKAATRKGGYFVYEFFSKGGVMAAPGFAPGELAKLFSDWKIVKDEVVDDIGDWGLRKAKIQRFVARKP